MDVPVWTGGCLCGAIRFHAHGTPDNAHTCACDDCRRHSGSMTVAWVEFPAGQVHWTGAGGAPSRYRSSAHSTRAFCPRCGSSLGAMDDAPVIALLTGVFDVPHHPALAPTAQSFEDGQPAWLQVNLAPAA
ncbi:GFA family protein [Bacillus subtilis subsp. subtilis]|nr:GFA family protein [Bacillus subtilis subsp. subtilis]